VKFGRRCVFGREFRCVPEYFGGVLAVTLFVLPVGGTQLSLDVFYGDDTEDSLS
jgi:hypothetical protein